MPLGIRLEGCIPCFGRLHIYFKCYKDTRKQIVEVQVDGIPSAVTSSSKESEASPVSSKDSVRILIDLRISNGLHIHQKNLSYQSLRSLIEKLEV